MNLVNIDHAIAIMERVKARGDRLNMAIWQIPKERHNSAVIEALSSEEDLHTCGSAACFAGWVAVSPEFKADGGWASQPTGAPMLGEYDGSAAIAEWLDVSHSHAAAICGIHSIREAYAVENLDDITVDHVLGMLHKLRGEASQ